MLELVRVRVRSLVRFASKATRATVYTDFEDTLGRGWLRSRCPGHARHRRRAVPVKARGYLRAHEDALALQRLRRNKQLTGQDLSELEGMLHHAGAGPADLVWASHQPGGLGLLIRSLVGLERAAAEEAFTDFLGDGAGYTVSQVRFVDPPDRQGTDDPGRDGARPAVRVALHRRRRNRPRWAVRRRRHREDCRHPRVGALDCGGCVCLVGADASTRARRFARAPANGW